MKYTALIAAAALACGTAALAQQQDTTAGTRGEESARVDQQDHGTAGEKVRNAMHKLGDKTRHAMHRVGDAARHVAHRDDKGDTRAMGAGASPDAQSARQQRMDDAYANWHAKQDKSR